MTRKSESMRETQLGTTIKRKNAVQLSHEHKRNHIKYRKRRYQSYGYEYNVIKMKL